MKNTFLILVFSILAFLIFPNTTSAACGDGWFCGIDQGYGIRVNISSMACGSGPTCSNNGTWNRSGNYDCKNECYTFGGQTFCITTKILDCSVIIAGIWNSLNVSPVWTANDRYSSCSISGSQCTLSDPAVTTTCCVRNTSPTPTATSGPTDPPTTPSCNLGLTPTAVNPLLIGSTSTFTATLSNINDGTVSNVTFSSNNTGVATVNPASDSSSPYNSIATGVAPGTATITANGIMSGSSRCSDTSIITVPTPSCTISLTPATANVTVGGTQVLTATTTLNNGAVISRVDFTKTNTNVSMSPTADTISPFSPTTTTVTGATAGTTTVTATATLSGGGTCVDTSTITVPTPSCTVNLLPDTPSITLGNTVNFVASVTPTNGTVSQVNFLSGNTSIATVNPASDTTVSYSTVATGASVGSTTVRADVIMSGVSRCNDTSTITITNPSPWWQVKDGDVTTNGDISSSVFPAGTQFILDGSGGFPGVPTYSGSLSVGIGTISSKLWNANTSTTQGKLFDYLYFNSLIPSDVIPTVATNASLRSTGFTKYGYEWFKSDGSLTIEIDSNINFAGRKVILLVDGYLTIRSNINLTDGVGFFGTFVNGNINLNPAVTQLEGIYLADGIFNTNTGSNALWVRGSVASYGGITLGRDLVNNDGNPAELFEYGPDQVMLFPSKLAFRRTKWVEVAP